MKPRFAVAAVLVTVAALLVAFVALPVTAQESDLREEVEALKQGQEEIRRELAEVKKLVQSQRRQAPAGPNVEGKVFELGDNPVKGEASAELTLIEFMDYQCGYCGRHLRETYPKIVEEFVDTGKLRYAVLDLPLERIHPLAMKAAEATHCAADQGKFWEMHDRLFANQKSLEPWSGHAEALGLDVAAFDSCLETGKHAEGVKHDMAQASKAGASGTPSFVLARTDPADPNKVTGISFIRGAQPFSAFEAAISGALE